MTNRLVEEIIWDTRKAVPLKKIEGAIEMPCIVQTAEASKASQRPLPAELSNSQPVLLHSIVTHKKIRCHCVTSADDDAHIKKQFFLPVGFKGLVELLSASGQASAPFKRIAEVAKAATEQFLIRSKVEGLAEITDKTSIRTLGKGTVLVVKGTARVTSKLGTESYLHCTDKHGFYVYLNYDIAGVFSPFAGPRNISGVHTVQSLLKSFRLPCTIRVVSGKIPRQACDDEEPGVFRLLELRREKTAILSPLSAKQILIPLSIKADISFYRPANMNELRKHFIFNQVTETCNSRVDQYLSAMQVIARTSQPTPTTKSKSQDEENHLFEDVDEIYPYIRQGGIPPRMLRARSLDGETTLNSHHIYNRSHSHPVINVRERSASLAVSQLVKQHTISSSKTETTFEFQSNSDNLTLGKTNVLRQFIDKYTSKESLSSSQGKSSAASDDDIYFTLDSNCSHGVGSVTDILSLQGECVSHRG